MNSTPFAAGVARQVDPQREATHLIADRRPTPPGARRYRTRPVDVDAVQWTGSNIVEVQAFLGADFMGFWADVSGPVVLLIRTLENPANPFEAPPGWWGIRGIRGEHYACAPDIFAQTYEAV